MPKLIVGYNDHGMNPGGRMRVAVESRAAEQARSGGTVEFCHIPVTRNAMTIYGHSRPNPFLRDMLTNAVACLGNDQQALPPENEIFIGYAHAENVYAPGFAEWFWRAAQGAEFVTSSRIQGHASAPRGNYLEIRRWFLSGYRDSDREDSGASNDFVAVRLDHLVEFCCRVPDVVAGITGWGMISRHTAAAMGLQTHSEDLRGNTRIIHLMHDDHPGERAVKWGPDGRFSEVYPETTWDPLVAAHKSIEAAMARNRDRLSLFPSAKVFRNCNGGQGNE